MRIFKNYTGIREIVKNPVITIGNFDGVHKGHQNIFRTIIKKASLINGESVVLTFDPHPLKVFTGENKLFLLTPTKKKVKLIEKFGIENLILVNFTKEFADIGAEEFVRDILVNAIGTKELYVGYNYFFGKNKKGNVNLLKTLGKKMGFKVNIIEPFYVRDKVVSSTLCRELIVEGKVGEVADFLGRYYLIEGRVVKGKRMGCKLGFPTANIKSPNEVYPRYGVYAVKVGYKGKIFNGACSIGFNPTFESCSLTVEVHLLGFKGDLYNETLKIVFVDRIRDMKKFSSIDELKKEIEKDISKADKILNKIKISFSEPQFI